MENDDIAAKIRHTSNSEKEISKWPKTNEIGNYWQSYYKISHMLANPRGTPNVDWTVWHKSCTRKAKDTLDLKKKKNNSKRNHLNLAHD